MSSTYSAIRVLFGPMLASSTVSMFSQLLALPAVSLIACWLAQYQVQGVKNTIKTHHTTTHKEEFANSQTGSPAQQTLRPEESKIKL